MTESGGAAVERTLDYLYLGQGGSWYEASYNGEGSEAYHEWETTQSVFQTSTSTQTLNKNTTHATGSPVTTGGGNWTSGWEQMVQGFCDLPWDLPG